LEPSFAWVGREGGFDAVALQKYPMVEAIQHVHHAGNSSAIVDGAALVLLGSEALFKRYGLRPRARIVSWAVVGTEPTIMLLGPAPASRKALSRASLSPQEIDLYEVNGGVCPWCCFAFMDDLGRADRKDHGECGAIAMGHRGRATGAMLLGTC
jgi:acetyl-CoA C-acetyltransferase